MPVRIKSIVFLALAFAISWGITIGAYYAGLREGPWTLMVLTCMMAGPAIAALICAFAFENGRRVDALGLLFKPNVWWIYAWLIPLALAAASVVATILFSDRAYIDPGTALVAMAEEAGQDLSATPPFFLSTTFVLIMSVFVGPLINAPILTITEELGWRGYLHDLWRPSGFWRASLSTGFVWGVWHAPAILLYGLNYPENGQLGAGIFIIWCMLLSPLLTLVRDRGGSVLAAGIFHGTINAVAGLTLLALTNPVFPWNGIVGIGGFVALALGAVATALLVRPSLASKPAEA